MSRRGLELEVCFHSIKEGKKGSLRVVLLMMDDRTSLDSNCGSSRLRVVYHYLYPM
ncbi:unnamed protein product [Amoebophrya sp. A25]|nr:unnamed protein product [Amoebophrya sp. A25]|eukprot:GSA25T00014525001.1